MNILSIVGLAVVGLLMVGLVRQASSEMATLLTMALGVVLFLWVVDSLAEAVRSLEDLALRARHPARVYQSDIENRRDIIHRRVFRTDVQGRGRVGACFQGRACRESDNSAYRHPGIQGNSVGP